jgi:hypothetical protein
MVPLIIGFLASVIGLGGIGAKVREIVQSLQKPVNKAVDFVIDTGLKVAAPIIRGLAGVSSKVKAKVAAGKAWVKGKAEAGKAWVKNKVYGGDDSPEGKQQRLDRGMASGVTAANRFAGKTVGEKVLKPVLSVIGKRHGLAVLEPVMQGENWAVHGEVQRAIAPTRVKGAALPAGHLAPLTPTEEAELIAALGNDALHDLVPTVAAKYLLDLHRAGAPAAMVKSIAAEAGAAGLARVAASAPAATAADIMKAIAATPGVGVPVAMDMLGFAATNGWPASRIAPFFTAAAGAGVNTKDGWRDIIWWADKFALSHVGSTDPGGGVPGAMVGSVAIRWRENEMATIELHDNDIAHFAARHTVQLFDFSGAKPDNSLFDHTVKGSTLERAVLDGLREASVKEAIKNLIVRAHTAGNADAYTAVPMSVGAGSGRLQVGIRVALVGGIWTGRTVNLFPSSGVTNISGPRIAAIRQLIGK